MAFRGHTPPRGDKAPVSSAQNPVFKMLGRLVGGNPADGETMLVFLEGEKLLREADLAGWDLRWLVSAGTIPEDLGNERTVRLNMDAPLLNRLSRLETPAPLMGVVESRSWPTLEATLKVAETVVVLDRVQDPGNVGTIARSLEALGGEALLLLKGSCSAVNDKAIRASMGALFRVPVYVGLEPETLFNSLSQAGISTVATSACGCPLWDFAFPRRVALLMGTEGEGLRPEFIEMCEACVSIPMRGRAESLNVAAATAICLYERHRGGKFPNDGTQISGPKSGPVMTKEAE